MNYCICLINIRLFLFNGFSNHWTFMYKITNNIVLQNRKCFVAKYTSRICMLNFMLVIGPKNQKVTKQNQLSYDITNVLGTDEPFTLGHFQFLVSYYRCIKYQKGRKIITCLTSTSLLNMYLLFEHVHNAQQILHYSYVI